MTTFTTTLRLHPPRVNLNSVWLGLSPNSNLVVVVESLNKNNDKNKKYYYFFILYIHCFLFTLAVYFMVYSNQGVHE